MGTVEDRAITWGHPSYVWRSGQERRLALVCRHTELTDRRILDVGCGIGAYLRQLRRFSSEVYGVDIDEAKLVEAGRTLPNLAVARGEALPFGDGSFDVVFLHEVLEHVEDDAAVVRECYRVLREGGDLVIYAPNRLYPFETHGFYLGRRYIYRLLPLVNYLPDRLRRRFVPHVRAYRGSDLRRLFCGLGVKVRVHGYVYPGFDGIASRHPVLASWLRRLLHAAERTPLRIFGLSHFLVVSKVGRGEG